MHDVALKRRIAALVLATLLAISGAALTSAYFAADAHAATIVGTAQADMLN
jgi:hypothetical protein